MGEIRLRRGVEANRILITPAVGEPLFTTDTKKLYVGDGQTPGGVEIQAASGNAPVKSVAGRVGDVLLTRSDVGLTNVDNTSDAGKPVSNATQTALNAKYDASNPSGYITSSQAATAAPVQSVAGKTGAVSLAKADVGLSNVDNTSDASKPVSAATQTALDTKEPAVVGGTSSQYYRGDKVWRDLNKTVVGLSNVDNTSDASKPISTATQTALNGKENSFVKGSIIAGSNVAIAGTLTNRLVGSGDITISATGGSGTAGVSSVNSRTGDVTLTKSDVGLANADNTADVDKPVSTATQTALNAKVSQSTNNSTNLVYTRLTGTEGTTPVSMAGSPNTIARRTATGELTVAAGVSSDSAVTKAQLDAKQDTLVSGSNIKTINGNSVLGSGDLTISGGGSTLTTQDEGTTLTTATTSLNFTGAGVTATNNGGAVTIDVPAGSGLTNPMTTAGDIIVGGTSGTPTRLAASATANRVLGTTTANGSPTYIQVPLASAVTGTLPVANGGSSRTGLTAYALLSGGPNTSAAMNSITNGASGTVLKSNGTSAYPSFSALSAADVPVRVVSLTASTNTYTIVPTTTDEAIIASPAANYTVTATAGTDGQKIILRTVTGTTAYTRTSNAIFVAGNGTTLPTVYPPSTTVNELYKYDSTLAKWVLLSIDLPQNFFVPMFKAAMRSVSAATTITNADGYIRFTGTAAISQALPTTFTAATGLVLKNRSTATVTITSQTDGATGYQITAGSSATFVWTGTEWERN